MDILRKTSFESAFGPFAYSMQRWLPFALGWSVQLTWAFHWNQKDWKMALLNAKIDIPDVHFFSFDALVEILRKKELMKKKIQKTE